MSSSSILICDLDHTLASKNVSFCFGGYLYSKKMMSNRGMISCVTGYLRHKYLGLSIPELYASVFDHVCRGKDYQELCSIMSTFYDCKAKKWIDRTVLQKIHEGFPNAIKILLSSSPDFIVREFGIRCEFDLWKGTEMEYDSNLTFRRIKQVIDGEAKARFVRHYVEETPFCLSEVAVMTDSIQDLPLLEIVGRPIAVNPDLKLKAICRTRNWEVIRTNPV